MYEIWLAINIVYEIALGIWPWLLLAAVAWTVLALTAWRRPLRQWRANCAVSLGLGVAGVLVALFAIPALTQSSIGEMGYWVDWGVLTGMALAAGAAVFLVAWPALSLWRKAA